LKNSLLILIVVDRAYASFAILSSFLKMVTDIEVANVVLECVDLKVAKIRLAHLKLLIELKQLKVQNVLIMNLRSGRLFSV
jgi:hypothetical protein